MNRPLAYFQVHSLFSQSCSWILLDDVTKPGKTVQYHMCIIGRHTAKKEFDRYALTEKEGTKPNQRKQFGPRA